MKNGFYILLIGVLIAGCDDKLDIKPEDTLVETDVFAEEALAERALGEAYIKLVDASTNTSFALADFTTDITMTNDNEFYNKFINGNLRPEDQTVSDFWLQYYATINSANGLIVNIPRFGAYDEEVQMQHIGEAKFIRAFAYLKLITLYGEGALSQNLTGLGLPLQLTPFEGYNENDEVRARSSVQEVYNQIIKDLEEAAEVVPESFGTSSSGSLDTRSRATKGSVYALLSRAYLYMGLYEEAATYAQEVLALSSIYQLASDLTDLFPDNSIDGPGSMDKEYVFGFPFSENRMGSNNLAFSYYYKLSFWADEDFVSEYPDGDLRADTLIYEGDTQFNQHIVNGRRTTIKYSDPNGRDNVPLIRLAEVMLTRAEALARTNGVNQESIDLLNAIYQRANPNAVPITATDFTSGQALVNRILKERKLELAFEGHARFDLIRTGQPLRNQDLPQEFMTLPIPQIDIDISRGVIVQNPGY